MHSATRWKISGALALLPMLLPAIFLWPALTGRFVPSFRDQSDFFLPSHQYTAARIARHELPLWNPLAGNGETWIGNGQNQIFYPPALLFLARNAGIASGIYLFLHFAAGYLLTFLFLRERGSTRPASVLGASLFAFSGLAVSLSAYWNHFAGMVWIPGMAAAAIRGLRTRKQRAAFAACLGAAILAGSPESALFGAIAAIAIFALERSRDRQRHEDDWTVKIRRWNSLAGAILSGGLLGAIVALPLLDTILRSDRRSAGAGAIPLRQLASLIHSPSLTRYGWLPPAASFVQTLYLSLPIVLLAALGLLALRRSGERLVWALFAAVPVVLSLTNATIPFRYPAKLLMLTLLVISVLAAEGVDGLRFGGRMRYLAAGALLAGAAASVASWTGSGRGEKVTLGIGAALVALSCLGSPDFRGVLASLGAAALAAHLAVSAVPLVRYAQAATFAKPPLPAAGKVLTSPDGLLSEWATSALPDENLRVRRQIDSLEGYSNLPFGIAKATTGSALPSREASRFMARLANRSDFIVPAMVSGSKEIRFPSGGRVAHVVVPETLSGVAFFFAAEVEPDFRAAIFRATSSGFDPRRRLLVGESPPDAPIRGASSGRGVAVGSTVSETPERIEYKVDLSETFWMYRAQSKDPWWTAELDGRPTRIVRANGVFSAIVVPKGNHRIVLAYRPWPFYAGAAVSAAALVALLFLSMAGEPIVRTRRG